MKKFLKKIRNLKIFNIKIKISKNSSLMDIHTFTREEKQKLWKKES